MLRFTNNYTRRAAQALVLNQARCVSLQSEKPCATLADKIVRGKRAEVFYSHPSYVMAREKMLYTIWVDIGIFSNCVYFFMPFFAIAFFFKA